MASTPSASALTAVLRCRGNIWARNPPTKRPAASAYGLGLSGGPARHPPTERTRSQKVSTQEGFLSARIAAVGRKLTVRRTSPRGDGGTLREEDFGGTGQLFNAEVPHGPEDARAAACGGPLVRQLALQLASPLSRPDKRSRIVRMMQHAYPAQTCKIMLVVSAGQQHTGILKVSASSCWTGDAGQIPCLVVTGWDALKGPCSSLTELVSQLVLCKLAVFCGSSCGRKAGPTLRHHDVIHSGLQANTRTCTPTELNLSNNKTGPKVTDDRPD